MSYEHKIKEFQQSAELNSRNGLYNSAAGRAYYSAYLLVKNIVSPEDDTNEIEHGQILQKFYAKMYFQNTPVPKELSKVLKKRWSTLYRNRITADYKTSELTRDIVEDCLNALTEIKEILWKMQ